MGEINPLPTRAEVMQALLNAKNRPEKAALYADTFIEYRTAQANIEDFGAVTACPRTGTPIPNPFLSVRDKAFSRLEALHKAGVRASDLW